MNVDLDAELTRLGIARNCDLALEGAAVLIRAKTHDGAATNVQAALDSSSQEQQAALEALTTRFEEYCAATNRAISEIHQQMAAAES